MSDYHRANKWLAIFSAGPDVAVTSYPTRCLIRLGLALNFSVGLLSLGPTHPPQARAQLLRLLLRDPQHWQPRLCILRCRAGILTQLFPDITIKDLGALSLLALQLLLVILTLLSYTSFAPPTSILQSRRIDQAAGLITAEPPDYRPL